MSSTEPHTLSVKDLRVFGLTLGSIFAIIGLWPVVVRTDAPRLWALLIAGVIVVLALCLPKTLTPIHRVWMKIGAALGWVNTRIILSLGFYGLFTPIGWMKRLTGKDPMHRQFDAESQTYRVRSSRRPGSHMQRQF